MTFRLAALTLVATLAGCGAPPQASTLHDDPTPPTDPVQTELCHEPQDDFGCRIEAAIVERTNAYRAEEGRAALRLEPKIAYVAREWSEAMAAEGRISHDRFNEGGHRTVYVEEFGEAPRSRAMIAENVLMNGMQAVQGNDPERIGAVLAEQWWNSEGHRRNMLGNYQSIAVGVWRVKQGSWTSYYATQLFGRD